MKYNSKSVAKASVCNTVCGSVFSGLLIIIGLIYAFDSNEVGIVFLAFGLFVLLCTLALSALIRSQAAVVRSIEEISEKMPANCTDIDKTLSYLEKWYSEGLITEAEYENKKANVLERIGKES